MPEAIVFFPQHCVASNGFDRAVIDLVDASESALVLKSAFFDDALAGDVFFPGADHHDIEAHVFEAVCDDALCSFGHETAAPELFSERISQFQASHAGAQSVFGQSDTADDPAASLLDNSPHATFAKNGFDDFS